MGENIKYNYEVLGKKVAVHFKVGKKGSGRPYAGTIRRVQISLEEEGKYEVLHEVVFADGEEHWLDLAEIEEQGRLQWRDRDMKKEKPVIEVKPPQSNPEDTITPSDKPKPQKTTKSLKKLGQPIRVSLNKAKFARRAMLKSLVAACNEQPPPAVITPAQPPKKKRKREDSTGTSSSVHVAVKKASPRGSLPENLQWVEEMYDWMVHQGSDGRGATPKSALRIRKEVLNLATGEGITHRQWVAKGIKNFHAGQKVDLNSDMDELHQASQRFQDKHGKDPSHGWLMAGPIQKLKSYKNYVNQR